MVNRANQLVTSVAGAVLALGATFTQASAGENSSPFPSECDYVSFTQMFNTLYPGYDNPTTEYMDNLIVGNVSFRTAQNDASAIFYGEFQGTMFERDPEAVRHGIETSRHFDDIVTLADYALLYTDSAGTPRVKLSTDTHTLGIWEAAGDMANVRDRLARNGFSSLDINDLQRFACIGAETPSNEMQLSSL